MKANFSVSKTGLGNAVSLFKKASKNVLAYKAFLKSKKLNPGQVKNRLDFAKLPITDKDNYIRKYSLEKLFFSGSIPEMGYASSGSSGIPTFWFRGSKEENRGAKIHEFIFRKIFGISKKDSTLVIVCFSMGIWVAGGYTLSSCRILARKGHAITTVTPGIEKDDILQCLAKLAPNYQNTIIAGYPPFLMDVLAEAKHRKIVIPKKLKVLTAGESFTEKWRASFLELIGARDYYKTIISIYGSADGGILGHETPLTIFFKKSAEANLSLARTLQITDSASALFQYHPQNIYFEKYKQQLIFTVNNAIPLIRYNIQDFGEIWSAPEIAEFIDKFDLTRKLKKAEISSGDLPMLAKFGRADVAVTFYALNIYPQNFSAIFESGKIGRFLSGSFFVYNKVEKHQRRQRLIICFELKNSVKILPRMVSKVEERTVEVLVEKNIEYRKLLSTLGQRVRPKIVLVPFGRLNRSKNVKVLRITKGKKPKIIQQ